MVSNIFREKSGRFQKALSSSLATQRVGEHFGKKLQSGDVVALIGGLGTGKTTLVQGMVRGWGYQGPVASPTFALVHEYSSSRGILFHMDMYRLSPQELETFPLEDYLGEQGACVIEWADRVVHRLPAKTLTLILSRTGINSRFLRIEAPGYHRRKR